MLEVVLKWSVFSDMGLGPGEICCKMLYRRASADKACHNILVYNPAGMWSVSHYWVTKTLEIDTLITAYHWHVWMR